MSEPPITYPGPPIKDALSAPMTALSFESKSDLVIGIDFGTTFTGVAYAHVGGAHFAVTTTSDMRSVAEKVHVIKSWPAQGNQFAEKTPTVLSYNTDPPTWGANVRPKDEPRI